MQKTDVSVVVVVVVVVLVVTHNYILLPLELHYL
jgi:hypothetical protein